MSSNAKSALQAVIFFTGVVVGIAAGIVLLPTTELVFGSTIGLTISFVIGALFVLGGTLAATYVDRHVRTHITF